CTILQAEESRRVLHVLGTTGIDSNVPLRKMHYPYGFSCSGWIAANKQTLATEDYRSCEVRQGPVYTDITASVDRFQYLGAPLLSNDGEMLGVVRLRNKIPPTGFAWPTCLNYLDRKRVERVAKTLAPLISLMIKERERSATMERIRHDIDMPATAIRDSAGILVREPDAAFQNDLTRVRQRLEDMESFAEILLVNSELMGLDRIADVPFRPENVLPLAGFVAKLCKMLSPAARRKGLSGILYNQGSFFSIPSLWMDPRLFQIAMYNLLQNAIKYSNPGTVVTVEGDAQRSDVETWYNIHVKNTGIGITDDEAPYIFDRAYRSKRARKRSETGLGIGLTTAKELIERHGGRLILTKQNNPTIFTIALPGYLATRRPE
ncbi:MAG: sensor histidine kinase, partial [Phycisphaerae bacterium]